MKSILLATAITLAMPVGVSFADEAIANSTTTSMGVPVKSSDYAAPSSAAIPGLSGQTRLVQQLNRGHEQRLQANAVKLTPRGAPAAL